MRISCSPKGEKAVTNPHPLPDGEGVGLYGVTIRIIFIAIFYQATLNLPTRFCNCCD